MKVIQVSSQLVGATPLVNKGMNLRFHTKEITAQEKIVIMESFQKMGWLLFKEDETDFTDQDIPKENSGYEDGRTPSMRLRAVIFRYWEQFKKQDKPDFETFYRKAIEEQIQVYKEKLTKIKIA